jgi:hypothetical protein
MVFFLLSARYPNCRIRIEIESNVDKKHCYENWVSFEWNIFCDYFVFSLLWIYPLVYPGSVIVSSERYHTHNALRYTLFAILSNEFP